LQETTREADELNESQYTDFSGEVTTTWYWSCWWTRWLPCTSDISGYDMQNYVSWDVRGQSLDN